MKRNVIRLTESQLHNVIKESVKRIINEMNDADLDRAAFENACDCLYYGYGFNTWRKGCSHLDNVTADRIWNAAFKKMSEDPTVEMTPHSIESYDWLQDQNDEKLNVQPNEDGRYPDENLNVLDNGESGKMSLYAQGALNHKLNGIKAIKDGGLGLKDAKDEWEKNFNTINASTKAQRAFKQGRIGHEKPLWSKSRDALNGYVPS